jgi:hypothetical protein
MRCPDCHSEYFAEDLNCRKCGADLMSSSTSIVSTKSNLPALLYNPQLPRRVAAGVGALALGVGIELVRRNVLARLSPTRSPRPALPVLSSLKDAFFSPQQKVAKLPKGYEVHETVIYMQRVTRRRD